MQRSSDMCTGISATHKRHAVLVWLKTTDGTKTQLRYCKRTVRKPQKEKKTNAMIDLMTFLLAPPPEAMLLHLQFEGEGETCHVLFFFTCSR